MPKYRILLVEELVLSDSGEFSVEAATPEAAAAILFDAHNRSRDECENLVRLPDGQERNIEPDAVDRTRAFCVLLDDAGEQIKEIQPDGSPPQTKNAEPVGDPDWLYDRKNWECTYAWADRIELTETAHLSVGDIREFSTLRDGPPIYAASVPIAFDEHGYPDATEIQWRQSRAEIRSALAAAWAQSPNPDYAAPTSSPWGAIQTLLYIAPGIYEISTASHGGLKLSQRLNDAMPDFMRSTDGWYEEDCKWSLVALKYPEPFKAETGIDPNQPSKTAYEVALECARHWYPDAVEQFFNTNNPTQDTTSSIPPATEKNTIAGTPCNIGEPLGEGQS